MDAIDLQKLLLESIPTRRELMSYIPTASKIIRVGVYRNHSFELVEHTIGAFLDFGGLQAQFEYSDYCDGNNLYHDICSTSEDEDICRHSRCGNCSCDCRCKNSGNNDGNERKLPSAPYSCMAESGKICVGRWISDHAGIVCDRIWWLFW